MEQGVYSLSSPVWSNFGKKRGLPISCFGSNIADDMGNILYSQSEVGMMSKLGGGTSGYFGHIRHRGAAVTNNGEASGSVHIMQLFESMVDVVSQGSVRRGRFSPYLPIEHKDISEFLDIDGMISYNNSGLVGGVVGKFLNDFIGFYGYVIFLIVSTTFSSLLSSIKLLTSFALSTSFL